MRKTVTVKLAMTSLQVVFVACRALAVLAVLATSAARQMAAHAQRNLTRLREFLAQGLEANSTLSAFAARCSTVLESKRMDLC